jgi:hypothetical protein
MAMIKYSRMARMIFESFFSYQMENLICFKIVVVLHDVRLYFLFCVRKIITHDLDLLYNYPQVEITVLQKKNSVWNFYLPICYLTVRLCESVIQIR